MTMAEFFVFLTSQEKASLINVLQGPEHTVVTDPRDVPISFHQRPPVSKWKLSSLGSH